MKGTVLASQQAHIAIAACSCTALVRDGVLQDMPPPSHLTIHGVPVVLRGEKQFARASQAIWTGIRLPLLCNSGIKGSGKSTQQFINMWMHTRNNPNHVAVEVTFNDDFLDLGFLKDDERRNAVINFPKFVAVQIVLRLALHLSGFPTATTIQNWCEKHKTQHKALLGLLAASWFHLSAMMTIFRRFFHKDVRVLLAIDELLIFSARKRSGDELFDFGKNCLSTICREVDEFNAECFPNTCRGAVAVSEGSPKVPLFLSASVYHCVVLEELATDSARPLLLQPLPPIFPFADLLPFQAEALPPVVQLFSEKYRKHLNFSLDELPWYRRLGALVAATAGHPRRVRIFLSMLREGPWRAVNEEATGTRKRIDAGVHSTYALKTLHDALSDENFSKVLDEMDGILNFEEQGRTFSKKFFRFSTEERLQLHQDLLFPFDFPITSDVAKLHSGFLQATQSGTLQYDEQSRRAYMPLPAMRGVGGTMKRLADALDVYSGMPKWCNRCLSYYMDNELDLGSSRCHNCRNTPAAPTSADPGRCPYCYCEVGDSLSAHKEKCRGQTLVGANPKEIGSPGKLFERLMVETMLFCCTHGHDDGVLRFEKCGIFSRCGAARWWSEQYEPLKANAGINDGIYVTEADPFIFPCWFDDAASSIMMDKNRANTNRVLEVPGVYYPSMKFNLCADFIVTLNLVNPIETVKRVAFVVQTKEWFKDIVNHSHVIDKWRSGQQAARQRNCYGHPNPFFINHVSGENPLRCGDTVVVFLLMTANEVQGGRWLFLEADEALTSLEEMRKSFPSVGYNALAAHKLRTIFYVEIPKG